MCVFPFANVRQRSFLEYGSIPLELSFVNKLLAKIFNSSLAFIKGKRKCFFGMHNAFFLTCNLTLAVSSGNVKRSATQAALPAVKSCTARPGS